MTADLKARLAAKEDNRTVEVSSAPWRWRNPDGPDALARIEVLEANLRTVQNAAKTLHHCRDSELQHLRENAAFDHRLRSEHESLMERDALMTDALLAAEARAEKAEAERDAALKECSEWARQAGEAIGRLEMSEAAGVVEGWRERAEKAEGDLQKAAASIDALLSSIVGPPVGAGDGQTRILGAPPPTIIEQARDTLRAIRGEG